MTKHSPLTLAFIEQKPLAAGREFASLKPEEAALFLDSIPIRYAAPVLAAMGSWSASCVVALMAKDSGAAVLRSIDYRDAAAILRCLAGNDRSRILGGLPEKLQRDFETSLSFPEHTVGAHMTTTILTLQEGHTIADAVEIMRKPKKLKLDAIYIVDSQRKLIGVVTASDLFKHSRDTPLGTAMDRGVTSISARTTLASIGNLSAWDDYMALPVISRQKIVIGALLRKTVSQPAEDRHPSLQSAITSIPISIVDAFYVSAVGLARLFAVNEQASQSTKRWRT